jgi:hypothetical protein
MFDLGMPLVLCFSRKTERNTLGVGGKEAEGRDSGVLPASTTTTKIFLSFFFFHENLYCIISS